MALGARTPRALLFLCVYLGPPGAAAQPAPEGPAGACNVRGHGATGARAQNATAAVQAAIDACHGRGGGTVYVPPGEYTTGTLVLKADFPAERAFLFADGALVRGCRPLPGRFLHVGGRSRSIHLVGNDLSRTRVPVSYASEELRGAVALEGNLVAP